MKATRDGFGDQLFESAKNNENIIVVGADLGKATRTTKFSTNFPDRFFEVGIAECNMIGISSGLAEHGFKVVISSFASFLTGKYDVIRVSLAYSNSPVVIIGTHSGMAIGKDGVTQMGLEDISLMRSLPNMKVFQPASYNESKSLISWLLDNKIDGPAYVRLGRQPVEEVYQDIPEFKFNKANYIKKGSDVCFMVSGCILHDTVKAAELLDQKGISCGILNFTTLKPIDKDEIINAAKNYSYLVSVEDHSIIGGLGTIISEVLTSDYPKKLLRIGLNDVFPESGSPSDLYEKYELDYQGITKRVLNYVNK